MRTHVALKKGWHIRRVAPDEGALDVQALSREVLALRDGDHASPGAHTRDGWLPATMPAQVHEVLLAHGLLPDPRVGRNAAECAWVAESDWLYGCTFPTPEPAGGPTVLRCHGLDTLATAYLNGAEIGAFDSMFREHSADVTASLAPAGGRNVLLLRFRSPVAALARLDAPDPEHAIPRHHWLRKAPADFGSQLGVRPHWITVGVHRDVVLDVYDRAWIDDLVVRTEVAPDGSAPRCASPPRCRGGRPGCTGRSPIPAAPSWPAETPRPGAPLASTCPIPPSGGRTPTASRTCTRSR